MKDKKAVILCGSPKPGISTSEVFSEFIKDKFSAHSIPSKILKLRSYIKREDKIMEMVTTVSESDIIFILSPLYVDSISYDLIRSFELIRKYTGSNGNNKLKKYVAVSHSGLDIGKNQVSVKILESFGKELNYKVEGIFAFGFSGFLNGTPLDSCDKVTKNLQKGFEIMVNSLASDQPIPPKARKLISKPLMKGPMFLNKFLLNHTMKDCYKKKDLSKGLLKVQEKVFK